VIGPEVVATPTEVFASWGGPVYRLAEDGEVTQQWRAPNLLEPMIPESDATELVLERITDVPMSRAVREAIAERLGVDIEDVGTAPSRKKRSA
jgi:hypothetical protein